MNRWQIALHHSNVKWPAGGGITDIRACSSVTPILLAALALANTCQILEKYLQNPTTYPHPHSHHPDSATVIFPGLSPHWPPCFHRCLTDPHIVTRGILLEPKTGHTLPLLLRTIRVKVKSSPWPTGSMLFCLPLFNLLDLVSVHCPHSDLATGLLAVL